MVGVVVRVEEDKTVQEFDSCCRVYLRGELRSVEEDLEPKCPDLADVDFDAADQEGEGACGSGVVGCEEGAVEDCCHGGLVFGS